MALARNILLLVVVGIAYSDNHKCNTACRNITVISNFSTMELLGTWYVYQVSDKKQSTRKCFSVEVQDRPALHLKKIFWEKEINNTYTPKVVEGNVTGTTEISKFYCGCSDFPRPLLASIIGFQKGKFITIYVCWPEHYQHAMIYLWTRVKNPDKKIVEEAHNSIINAGLGDLKLHSVDQTKCDTLPK